MSEISVNVMDVLAAWYQQRGETPSPEVEDYFKQVEVSVDEAFNDGYETAIADMADLDKPIPEEKKRILCLLEEMICLGCLEGYKAAFADSEQ